MPERPQLAVIDSTPIITKRLGLTLTGTLGVLLRAKNAGLMPSVAPLIEQLLRGGIHLGDAVIAEALKLAGEV
jgi:predicted nucleic acid-binding protein